MGKKRHTAEQTVANLWQVEVVTTQRRLAAETGRSIGVTEVTSYLWRSEYGGLNEDHVKR
jgi:hypothetical protein